MPKVPLSPQLELVYDRDGIQLWCGDAKELLPTLADASVDFIFTDPPYGHNNNNGDLIHRREVALGTGKGQLRNKQQLDYHVATSQNPARAIANDGPEEANDLIRWAFREFNRLLKPGSCCCCCCCGGGGPDPQFARWSLWLDDVVGFKQMVVWDKGPMGMGWHYRRSYETVLVGEKPGAACKWYDESCRVENIIRPGAHGVRKIIPSTEDHPTEKPVELAKHFLRLHSLKGDLVLDPFLGSGSTALAAFEMGRRFIGVDLNCKHVELARQRLDNSSGGGMLMELRKVKRLGGRTRP